MKSIYVHTYHVELLEECNHHQIPCVGFSNIVIILIVPATFGLEEDKTYYVRHNVKKNLISTLNYNVSQYYQTNNLHQH